MSILSTLKTYGHGKWQVVNSETFSSEDLEAISSAHVVESQYGMSVCLMLRNGLSCYLPVSRDCHCEVGQKVNLAKAQILTLSCEGEDDIRKISF